MSKKAKKKKSPYAEDGKVRIRQSYYTFAKEFPSRVLPFEGKRRKTRKQRMFKNILLSFLFVVLMCLSYFTLNFFLDISYSAENVSDTTAATESTEGEILPFDGEKVRALYMPAEKLGDKDYIRELIKQIKSKNGNSVIIDFKDEEGRLSYSSMNEYAIVAKCALFDNNTVRQALDIFEEKEIRVIARIYCFEDSIISETNKDFAVKYMNTDINWLDSSDSEQGKSRLNPYSKGARNYIRSIITEVLSFKVDGLILEGLSFPSGEHISGATYPGESKKSRRNSTLKAFITEINEELPEECLLLLSHTAKDIVEVNNDLYSGEMLSADVDGFVVDTKERDEKYIIDKKTDYTLVFSLFSALKEKTGEKTAVYRIDSSEYSRAYLRKMVKSGYDSFIIFSGDGIY